MNEQVSALADGELSVEEMTHEISLLLSDKKAMQAWCDYQMMGDVMRKAPSLNANFTHTLMQKLELEPTVLAPNAIVRKAKEYESNASLTIKKLDRLPAAWSIAASCAAVLVVGWVLLNQQLNDFSSGSSMSVAAVQPTSLQAKNTQVLLNQPESTASSVEAPAASLEYLAAHQVSAPSVGSYYIQAASYSE